MVLVLLSGSECRVPCFHCMSKVRALRLSSGSRPPPQVCAWHACSTLALPTLQVVGVAHTFVEVWQAVAALLAELDVLLGFAELSVSAPTPYVRPQMLPTDGGELFLVRNCARAGGEMASSGGWHACGAGAACACQQDCSAGCATCCILRVGGQLFDSGCSMVLLLILPSVEASM